MCWRSKHAPNYRGTPKDVAVTDPASDAGDNEYIVYRHGEQEVQDARALTVRDTIH